MLLWARLFVVSHTVNYETCRSLLVQNKKLCLVELKCVNGRISIENQSKKTGNILCELIHHIIIQFSSWWVVIIANHLALHSVYLSPHKEWTKIEKLLPSLIISWLSISYRPNLRVKLQALYPIAELKSTLITVHSLLLYCTYTPCFSLHL